MEPDTRDAVVDFTRQISTLTGIGRTSILCWLDLAPAKYYEWKKRFGRVNMHNGWIPRDWWLSPEAKKAIVDYYIEHPFEGYRRLTYMMLDANVVAVSPATTWRVLSKEGLLSRNTLRPSKKGTGFDQPLAAHEHWHVDISYINIDGTFYYMCIVLDGYSRYIVHWEIRESMKECDIEIIIERAKERFPDARPRIISDNGPQFVSRDFKEFARLSGMTHVRTSPYYPQPNGKLERLNKTVKMETIRKNPPQSLVEARKAVGRYIDRYNSVRLHSAIGYIAPADKLHGKAEQIYKEREQKLQQARTARKEMNKAA